MGHIVAWVYGEVKWLVLSEKDTLFSVGVLSQGLRKWRVATQALRVGLEGTRESAHLVFRFVSPVK